MRRGGGDKEIEKQQRLVEAARGEAAEAEARRVQLGGGTMGGRGDSCADRRCGLGLAPHSISPLPARLQILSFTLLASPLSF